MLWDADNVEYRQDSKDAAFSGSTLIWCKHSDEYFTLEVLTAGTITLKFDSTVYGRVTLDTEMSVNGGAWTRIGERTITCNVGDKIRFRGEEVTYEDSFYPRIESDGTARYKIYGNIMSLMDGDNFLNSQGFNNVNEVFTYFFASDSGIVDASGLVLPEKQLTYGCYRYMFRFCENLVHSPKYLPAIDLRGSGRAYEGMFSHCSSLVDTPVIFAYYGGGGSFEHMFSDCTSLTTSPDIFVREFGVGCFSYMFDGCTSMTKITCRVLRPGDGSAFYRWVRNLPANGDFYKAHIPTWVSGENGIPTGWTIHNVQ